MSWEDRAALADLFNRYAEALDRKHWALLDQVFTEDVATEWPGGTTVLGRSAVTEYIAGYLGGENIRTHHMLGNFSATIEGGGAETSVYSRAVHQGIGEKTEGILDESLGIFAAIGQRGDHGWRFRHFSQEVLVKLKNGSLFAG